MKKIVLLTSGITIASALMAIQPTTAFAASTMQPSIIQLNGKIVSKPYRTVINATTYMPIFYVDTLLKQVGITASWNGVNKTWTLSSPNVASSLSIDGKTGPTKIVVNGSDAETHVPTAVLRDPSSGVDTTFMPIWFVQQLLNSIGFTPTTDTWNGSLSTPTWSLSTTGSPGASQSGSGYILDSSNSVNFIQLTVTDNVVAGSWLQTSVDSLLNLSSYRYSISGVKSGSQLTLDVQGYGSISGTLSSAGLTLSLPQTDGSLGTYTFTPGSSSTYNSDLAAFKQDVINQANTSENSAQVDTDAQQLEQDNAALTEALSTLSDAVNDANSIVAAMPQLLSTVQQDEQKVLQEVNSGVSPTSDMDQLSRDYGFLDTKYQMGIEQNDLGMIAAVQTDLTTYESDYATYLNDAAQVPSYQPSTSVPSQSSEAAFVKATQASIDNAKSTVSDAAAKALGFVQQGSQYDDTAYNAAQGANHY